jgi:hypothetical protein
MALADQIQGLPVNQAIGELIIAILGIDPLITKPRPLTQDQRQKIVRMPDLIRRATKRAMVASDTGKEEPSAFDFHEVNDKLSKVGPDTLKEILRVLPPDVGPVTETVLGRVLDFLHQQLPRHVKPSMFGDDEVRPGAPNELRAYARLWEVANDPMVVLNDLAHDRLKIDRVAALETLYPGLYQLILASVTSATSAIKGERPKWQPDPAKRRQIEILTQAQDPGGLGQVMDAVYTSQKQPQSTGAAPSRTVQAGNNVATGGQSTGQPPA